jgi:hypothetical protein
MIGKVTFQFLILLIGLVVYHQHSKKRAKAKLPPGPRGLPVLGNIRDLPQPGRAEYQHWLKFKDQYGPISSVTVGGQPLILIHGEEAAFELLEKNSLKTSDRPTQPFAVDHCGFGVFLPTLQYGASFRLHRKLVHQVFGTKRNVAKFRDVQDVESRRFLLRILKSPHDLAEHTKT